MIGGLVDAPLLLSYDDLLTLPRAELALPVTCTATTNHRHETRVWSGIALADLLADMVIDDRVRWAHFHSYDGYATAIEVAYLHDALLVDGIDGQPLTPDQGFPVRLIVAGLYGYKMPKWIHRIELAEFPLHGIWERRGWSLAGHLQPIGLFGQPNSNTEVTSLVGLSGTALGGQYPVQSVELSVDDGPWMPVPFEQRDTLEPAEWSIDWSAAAPGTYCICIRVTNTNNEISPSTPQIIVHITS